MKFIGGFFAGIASTIVVLILISIQDDSSDTTTTVENLSGFTMLSEKGPCLPGKQLRIFQTLKPNLALAHSGNYADQKTYLLVNFENVVYFDDMEIKIPRGKCARQFGTYKYETKAGYTKTVPAVAIE